MKIYEHNDKIKKNGSFNEWQPDIESKSFKLLINRFWKETYPRPQANENSTESSNETEENEGNIENETENETSAGSQQ